jgi:hypothetical protein
MAWLRWILWGVEVSLRTRHPFRGAVLVGCLYAMQILAGSPQVSYYTAMLLPCWWLSRSWALRKPLLGALRAGAVAALLALLLAAIQLLPSIEFVRDSARHAIAPERLAEQGLRGSYILRALVGYSGDPVEDTDSINAIGLGLLLLLPVALVGRRRRRLTVPLFVFSLAFLVLALGVLAPFFSRTLPLYGGFHAPRRALMIWSVLGPVAAAHGAQVLLVHLRRTPLRRVAPWVLLLLLGGNLWMLPRLERAFAEPARFDPHPADAASLGTDRFVTVDATFRYAHDSRNESYGLSIMPNLSSAHRLYDAQVYDPLVLARMAELRDAACERSGLFYPSHGIILSDPGSSALRLMSTRFVIGRWDAYAPGRLIPGASIDYDKLADSLELVRPHPRWPLWRFKEERPLAWIVETVAPAVDAEEAVRLALREDARLIAFTEEPVYLPRASSTPVVQSAHVGDGTIRVTFPAATSEEHFLDEGVGRALRYRRAGRDDSRQRCDHRGRGACGDIDADAVVRADVLPAGLADDARGSVAGLGTLSIQATLTLRRRAASAREPSAR